MTFTSDPPAVGDISLIPNADEKADLNAPSGSGGKLIIGQAPNITITETSVVADAAERLALDVQEGDVAIQTNVSSSFIFTGGDNIAPNWQVLDFDAVGAIDGEDIDPSGISGANINSASAGQLVESDGSGGLQFATPAGGVPTGGIIMWSGSISNIPSGFTLCDGTNGTPDLTDRFVVGAGGSEAVGDTGGTDTQSVNVSVSDSAEVNFESSFSDQTFSDNRLSISGRRILHPEAGQNQEIEFHDGDFSTTNTTPGKTAIVNVNASGSDSFDNRPAYYALAYIMKT